MQPTSAKSGFWYTSRRSSKEKNMQSTQWEQLCKLGLYKKRSEWTSQARKMPRKHYGWCVNLFCKRWAPSLYWNEAAIKYTSQTWWWQGVWRCSTEQTKQIAPLELSSSYNSILLPTFFQGNLLLLAHQSRKLWKIEQCVSASIMQRRATFLDLLVETTCWSEPDWDIRPVGSSGIIQTWFAWKGKIQLPTKVQKVVCQVQARRSADSTKAEHMQSSTPAMGSSDYAARLGFQEKHECTSQRTRIHTWIVTVGCSSLSTSYLD